MWESGASSWSLTPKQIACCQNLQAAQSTIRPSSWKIFKNIWGCQLCHYTGYFSGNIPLLTIIWLLQLLFTNFASCWEQFTMFNCAGAGDGSWVISFPWFMRIFIGGGRESFRFSQFTPLVSHKEHILPHYNHKDIWHQSLARCLSVNPEMMAACCSLLLL